MQLENFSALLFIFKFHIGKFWCNFVCMRNLKTAEHEVLACIEGFRRDYCIHDYHVYKEIQQVTIGEEQGHHWSFSAKTILNLFAVYKVWRLFAVFKAWRREIICGDWRAKVLYSFSFNNRLTSIMSNSRIGCTATDHLRNFVVYSRNCS